MRDNIFRVLFVFGLFLVANACSSDAPGDLPADGDTPAADGDIVDSDGSAGDEQNGDSVDGDTIDGDQADAGQADDDEADGDGLNGDPTDGDELDGDGSDSDAVDGGVADEDPPDGNTVDGGAGDEDESDGDAADGGVPEVYPPEYCAYFLTGEVELVGTDADGDGVPNGWDHCPNNPYDWMDTDRDGIGNNSDPDLDGDGVPNDEDSDQDGDGIDDATEQDAGTDPADPSSIPDLPRLDLDVGVLNPNPGWYQGDLHVHCEYSHDSSAPLAGYVLAAQGAELDFLAITDHRVFEAPFDPAWDQQDVLFLPGIEWGGPGHANIWGLRTDNVAVYEDVDDIRRAWRKARMQGGVQSLNHYGAEQDYWNWVFAEAPDLVDALDTIEIWNQVWIFVTGTNEPSVALWEKFMNQGHRIAAVGGGDSHMLVGTLGSPTTVVWAESLTVPGILHGIRSGRTYVTQADPLVFTGRPLLDFRVDADGDGVFEAMLGDEVPPGEITLQLNVQQAKGPLVLIRNGEEIARFSDHTTGSDIAHTFVDQAPPGAWYRVQMRENALEISGMRLMSSAIYVGQ